MNRPPRLVASDVAAAEAAMLFNVLPEIQKLPAPQQHARLTEHFETAFITLIEALHGWNPPTPSQN